MVEAATGSGKSTRLPLWLGDRGRTLVVEPRRMAARSLARYLAHCDGSPVGQRIGYAVRFDVQASAGTGIVFATPGVVLRWLTDDELAGFSYVMLDEFHERRWDTDLLAALTEAKGRHRLVVASATLDGAKLADHYGATHLTASDRTRPIEISHDSGPTVPATRDLAERVVAAVAEHTPREDSGDILVFLPGRGEIQAAAQALSSGTDRPVHPLHAGIPPEAQDALLAPGSAPRVILATNVAETALTLPAVRTVIDSGLERRTHFRNGRTVLALHPISQAAADQRAGRAGRTAPGRCQRLWSRAGRLEPETPPQVLREELDELVLAAAAAGHPAWMLRFPDPLPEVGLDQAERRLRALGALDEQGCITARGRMLFGLPLEPLFAHLIAAMPDRDTRAAMTDLAAAIGADSRLLAGGQPDAAREALADWLPERCEATALIRLVRDNPPEPIRCNRVALNEARRVARQLRETLELPAPSTEPVPRERLCRALLGAAPDLAFVRRKRRRDTLGNGTTEVTPPRGSLFPDDAEAALVLDQHAVPGKGTNQTLNLATVMAPVPLKWLAEAGLGVAQTDSPRMVDGQVMVVRQHIYGGRVIEESETEPSGSAAREALATLILDGALLAPLGRDLTEEVEAWSLYQALQDPAAEPVAARDWLTGRLAELGLETSADIALLEPEDLRFDGVPSWERERFDTHYPRRMALEELWLDVCYDVRRKRIELIKTDGRRKQAPQRSELPPWPGWRIRFRDGSRVIDIQ